MSPGHEARDGVPTGTPMTAAFTDVGLLREANEDFLAEFERPSGHRLLVVADGMGGHQGGATASRLCVESVGEVFRRSSEAPDLLLREALEAANERVHHAAGADPELSGMGTTAVLLLLTPSDEAWVAHVGDSRAYLLRDGVLRRLTEDHTVVAAMIQRGVLDPAAAESHPRRNELVRCVGFRSETVPEVTRVEVLPGDRFLLCSDGLSGQVPEDEIRAILLREGPSDAASMLVEAANAAGGRDNATVMITAVPGGATTEVDRSAPKLDPQEPASDERTGPRAPGFAEDLSALQSEASKHQRRRRAAAVVAIVAALFAICVLWLTLQ